MINKNVAEFPIIYSNPAGRYGIGWGVHLTVADECKKANIKKALIVTTGLKGTGIVDEINEILKHNGVSTEIFDKITSNPKDHEVMAGYEVFKEAKCDGVVSVGGGSSHDCGKAIRVVANNNGKHISEFYTLLRPDWMKEMAKLKLVTVPQVAVNTTAGTGAETSGAAFITDTKNRVKQGCMLPGVTPAIGLTDPLLVRLMPQTIAAWTGWDAFSHGFESYVSRIQVPHTKGIALQLFQIFAENIREFTYNRMNHVACEQMCWVQSLGGHTITFGGGGGIVHGIGHTISALTNGHHGRVNAALTVPGERCNQASCPDRFAEMASAMGIETRGMTKMQAADKWFDEVERLLVDLNIQTGHLSEQFGLQEKDLDHIVKEYFGFVSSGNASDLSHEEVLKLLKSAM